jgi:proton-dependent oligopeptide transporter, POT family
LPFAQRWRDIRDGFERPFWVANISELFERLSYYAAFASMTRYLHEVLQFPSQQASTFSGFFGGLVWFLPVFGGALADRMGFRRALALAYLILACSYFLLGSLGAPWLLPVRNTVPMGVLVAVVLALPAFGVALVKPTVVGTTARASKENVRSLGYSIYYTLVNIGGAAGPLVASYVHRNMSVENVFRVAALSVFLMFVGVLLFFREPRKTEEVQTTSLAQAGRNFLTVLTNPRFMLFLLIFTGYWVVYWQEFITFPLYIHDYVNPQIDTERLLATGPIVVILLTVLITALMRNVRALTAITIGTLITALGWIVLIVLPTGLGAVLTLIAIALGEITQSPRYYEYISRLAPSGQQGTYMGFAFLPLGIGSLIGGKFGGYLIHHYGEVKHEPAGMWWVIVGVGVLTATLLWVYDKVVLGKPAEATAALR